MAEEKTITPPPASRTERWTIPSSITVENDGHDPRSTKLIDTETGEQLKLPVHAMQLTVQAHQAPSLVIELARVAIRSTVHHVHFEISEEDLVALAKMNGYRVIPVLAFAAKMTSYGPLEHRITFRDFPDLSIVGENGAQRDTIERAEIELAAMVERLGQDTILPLELQEGEFLIWAHPAK